jgi:hypothetical protein
MGHEPMAPLKVIRARCIDCCSGSAAEVRLCSATSCPSWPYRMGTSPWRKELSPEEKHRRGQRAAKMRSMKSANVKSQPLPSKRAAGGAEQHAGDEVQSE